MKNLKKLSRRELLQYASILAASSRVTFPMLSAFAPWNSAKASGGGSPIKVLHIVYGEGVSTKNAAGGGVGKSLFSSTGTLSGRLTPGFSGLAGIENKACIIQNIGMENDSFDNYEDRISAADHDINNWIAPIGKMTGQKALSKVMQERNGGSSNYNTVAFTASTETENSNNAVTISATCLSSATSGYPSTFSLEAPITSISTLKSTLLSYIAGSTAPVGGGGVEDPNRVMRSNTINELLGISDSLAPTVSASDRTLLERFSQHLTNLKNSLGGSGSLVAGCDLASINPTSLTGASYHEDPIEEAYVAAEAILTSMACGGLDFATLCVFPTQGTQDIIPDFNIRQGHSRIPALNDFIINNIHDPAAFFSLNGRGALGYGNHKFSHWDNNTGSSWNVDKWHAGTEACMDFINTSMIKDFLMMARGLPGSTGTLADNLIIVHQYGFGAAHDHENHNCPIILASDKSGLFKQNHVKVWADNALHEEKPMRVFLAGLLQALGHAPGTDFTLPGDEAPLNLITGIS